MQSISMIGIGRAGGALALALSRAGYRIEHLVHRGSTVADLIASQIPSARLSPADIFPTINSDIVIITTADPDIGNVAASLVKHLHSRPVVLHVSGSLSSEVLSAVSSIGCPVGSMHPLTSMSDPITGSENLSNAFFCVEGDEKGAATAESIVRCLGGKPFSIPSQFKPLYHAAGVTASGHLVALIDAAIEMLAKCGIENESAKEILFPLIQSTLRNLEVQAPSRALTGSFARADLTAVERHLKLIDETMPANARDLYLILGERSLDLAAANGADADDIQSLRERILIAKRKSE